MVFLLHEQRYYASIQLSCHLFCLFDRTFLCLTYSFTGQVGGNTIVDTLWRAARQSNVSDYVYRRHQYGLKYSRFPDK